MLNQISATDSVLRILCRQPGHMMVLITGVPLLISSVFLQNYFSHATVTGKNPLPVNSLSSNIVLI